MTSPINQPIKFYKEEFVKESRPIQKCSVKLSIIHISQKKIERYKERYCAEYQKPLPRKHEKEKKASKKSESSALPTKEFSRKTGPEPAKKVDLMKKNKNQQKVNNAAPEGDIFKIIYGESQENLKKKNKSFKIPKLPKKSPNDPPKIVNSEENFEFGNKKQKYAYSEIIDVGQKDYLDYPEVPVMHKMKSVQPLLDIQNHPRSFQNQYKRPMETTQSTPIETKTKTVREFSKFDRFKDKDSDDSSSDEDCLAIRPSYSFDSFDDNEEDSEYIEKCPDESSNMTMTVDGDSQNFQAIPKLQQQNINMTPSVDEEPSFIKSIPQLIPDLFENGNLFPQQLSPDINTDFSKDYDENSLETVELFSPPKRLNPQIKTENKPEINMSAHSTSQRTFGIFDNVCESLLENMCSVRECAKVHELPDVPMIQQYLESFSIDAEDTYERFVRKYCSLFRKYFPIYADFFGKLKLINQLANAIKDCEHFNLLGYWHHIFTGLKKAEVTPGDAINIFINVYDNTNFNAFEKLLDLISSGPMETVQFMNYITSCVFEIPNYRFPVYIVNRFLRSAVSSQSYGLVCFVLQYLETADLATFSQINEPDLIQFLELSQQIFESTMEFKNMIALVSQKLSLSQNTI